MRHSGSIRASEFCTPARGMEVKGFTIDRVANTPLNRLVPGVALPVDHDLVISVANWDSLDMAVDTLSFE